MRTTRGFLLLVVFFVAAWSCHAAFQEEEGPLSGLSRQMRLGISFYEKGEDLQAMDRFMEVLSRGAPAERSLANEYINRITHRMNTGKEEKELPVSLRPNEAVAVPAGEKRPEAPPRAAIAEGSEFAGAGSPAARPAPMAERRPSLEPGMSPANRAVMKKEIKAKLRGALERGLKELRSVEGIRILMLENGDPQAIAIPTPFLFQSGIAFRRDAARILDALARMLYSQGGAQVIILPEGTAIGDAKILDMRRTMGLCAHLYTAGIAPPRVKVNFLNAQVDIPKALADFKGIVILFVYNQPLGLVVESSIGEESGPPLSLGVFPASLRPERDEGVIIEFSVSDPPAGLVSWKFQLLQPSPGEGRDLAPLQEVVGGGPVFHQIYWNGRQNYFGSPLPGGRYECVLTAGDSKNRQRTLHRWIEVLGAEVPARAAQAPPAQEIPSAAEARAGGAPSAELSEEAKPRARSLVKGVTAESLEERPGLSRVEIKKKGAKKGRFKKPSKKASVARKKGRRVARSGKAAAARSPQARSQKPPENPPSRSPAQASPAAAASAKPQASGHYQLDFNKDTHQLTPEAEKLLARVAETVGYYPLENLKIAGFAHSAEADAASLAERRAQMVAGLLINKYQVEPKKIRVASSVAETPSYKVEIDFVRSQ